IYRNVIGWYLQRITGALLVVLLAAHFWVEHFMSRELRRGDLTYEAILGRIGNPVWQFIDIAFLLVALYHGLNGVRNIVLDYSRVGRRAAQTDRKSTRLTPVTFLYLVCRLLLEKKKK